MIESGGGPGFTLKAFQDLRIIGQVLGKEFESDVATEVQVLRFVNDAHAAATETLHNSIM